MRRGDDDPANRDLEAFDPIFPFGHAFRDHTHLVASSNLPVFKMWLRVQPVPWGTLHVDFHDFELAERKDARYAASKGKVRQDATDLSDGRIGHEIAPYARRKLRGRAAFRAAYSRFFAGDFVDGTGFDPSGDRAFLQTEVDF